MDEAGTDFLTTQYIFEALVLVVLFNGFIL